MSTAEDLSLLAHLQTPILVGDPEGRIVYANPAFRDHFCRDSDDPMGQPLATVFDGGAREVVLTATAEVLQHGQSARLQIREDGHGYAGLASPIEAEDDRVGVVMVLLEEQSSHEHLTGLADEIVEPLAEAMQALSQSQDASKSDDRQALFVRGLRALETAQNWLRELQVALRGGKPQQGRFDVSSSILRVAERVTHDMETKLDLEVLMSPDLPRVSGTAVVFERLLTQLVQHRIEEAKSGQPVTLLGRTLGGDQPRGVLVSLVDIPDARRRSPTGHPPDAVQQGISSMGGEVVCVEDSNLGRVTSIRLPLGSG